MQGVDWVVTDDRSTRPAEARHWDDAGYLRRRELTCEDDTTIHAVVGNANDMYMFEDESFDLVVSNATFEHDKYFWLSLAEIRRVTRPGGLVVIGVPGFTKEGRRVGRRGTVTYAVHYVFDYYRFSEQAVRDVFFEGMDDVRVSAMLQPPRIIGHGRKPVRRRSGSEAGDRILRPAALPMLDFRESTG